LRPFAELVAVGRFVRPQGRKGELLTEPLSDRPGRLAGLQRAFVGTPEGGAREVRVQSCWPHKGRFVLKLEGVDSIDDAERLRGLSLGIGEEELPPLPSGSYYHHQLLGLAVLDEAGATLGRVAELLDAGAAPVLVVRGAAGERLIPLAHAFVRRVDLEAGCIVMAPPREDGDPEPAGTRGRAC
jgi:16S rRNA processing protein RimM